jgi:hypothetical protein
LCAVVAVVIGVAPSLLQFFAEQSLIKIRQQGVKITADGINGFILGVGADQIESWLPVATSRTTSVPVQFVANNLKAKITLPLFPPGLPVADISASLYGGEATARVADVIALRSVSLKLTNVDISLHPQLRAIGVEDGRISINAANHPIDLNWRSEASYSVLVESLRFASPDIVRNFIALNQISDGQIKLELAAKPGGEISITSGKFDSSLASGELTGLANISPQGDIRLSRGTVKVFLNRPDSSKLGNWLPLITNQKVSAETASFVCSFQAVSCSERHDIKLGRNCLRSNCG